MVRNITIKNYIYYKPTIKLLLSKCKDKDTIRYIKWNIENNGLDIDSKEFIKMLDELIAN